VDGRNAQIAAIQGRSHGVQQVGDEAIGVYQVNPGAGEAATKAWETGEAQVATRIEPEPLSIMSAKTWFAAVIAQKERRSAL